MKTDDNNFKSAALRNTRRLAWWTLAWVLSMALASFGPKFLWAEHKLITIAAIVLNLALGVMMILANRNLIRGLDELQRKIHLDAMAITLGVTLVAGLSYSLLDVTNIIPWDAEISFLVILMSLTYLLSLIISQRRYS